MKKFHNPFISTPVRTLTFAAMAMRQFSLIRPLQGLVLFVAILLQPTVFGALIISHDVTFHPDTGVSDFLITFDSTPDFFNVDSFGRQADSFQLFIDTNPSPTPFDAATLWHNATTIIRADEIQVFDDIRIRDRAPTSGDACSGGWGPIRGFVPFSISGASVSFSVPDNLLGVDGHFSYLLEGYNYGARNYDFVGTANAVQNPRRSLRVR